MMQSRSGREPAARADAASRIKVIADQLTPEKAMALLHFLDKVQAIRESPSPARSKYMRLLRTFGRDQKSTEVFFRILLSLRVALWDESNFAFKMMLAGAGIGMLLYGPMRLAGVASGTAFAVSVACWLVTAGAGAILGTIIDQVRTTVDVFADNEQRAVVGDVVESTVVIDSAIVRGDPGSQQLSTSAAPRQLEAPEQVSDKPAP